MDLLWVSGPAIPPNLVKAHVAKNTHARVRRERTARYHSRRPKSSLEQQPAARTHIRHEQHSHFTCVTPADTALCTRTCQDFGAETGGNSLLMTLSSPLDSQIFTQNHFECSHGPMSKFECSLVQYYVDVVISLNGDCTGSLTPVQAYKATVLFDWLPVALANPVMKMGFYLCSCRSLYIRTGVTRYYRYALQYKASCLRLLAESIATTRPSSREPIISDIIISTVLQLASDELIAGDLTAWGTHVNAINEIVRLSGGLDKIQGMKGLLRKLIEVLSSKDVLRLVHDNSSQNSDTMACIALEALLR
ncbi:hypothetical protein F4803DRAFT_221494 [Xylaria telfairii]|nr:hypothetical protein F4803DRAFT_221494 [Xylaria telfairii]